MIKKKFNYEKLNLSAPFADVFSLDDHVEKWEQVRDFIICSVTDGSTTDIVTYEGGPVEKYILDVHNKENEKVGEAIVFVYEEGDQIIFEVEIEGKR